MQSNVAYQSVARGDGYSWARATTDVTLEVTESTAYVGV